MQRWLYFLLFLPALSNAQVADSAAIDLDQVTIEAPITQRYGEVYSLDSSLQMPVNGQNLNSALNAHSNIHLRNYGRGAISSVSMRGGTAAQTRVFWNNLELNMASLGQFDLFLLDPILLSKMYVVPGGISDFGTSGGVGGSLHLQSLQSDTTLRGVVELNGYSTRGYRVAGSLNYGKGKWSGRTAVFGREDQNRFQYYIPNEGNKKYEMNSAGFTGLGFSQSLKYQKNNKTEFMGSVLYSQMNRKLHTVLYVPDPDDEQYDRIAAADVSMDKQWGGQWKLTASIGYQQQLQEYSNGLLDLNSPYTFDEFSAVSSLRHYTKDWWNQKVRLSFERESMTSDYYQIAPRRSIIQGAYNAEFSYKDMRLYAIAKALVVPNYFEQLMPVVGVIIPSKSSVISDVSLTYAHDARIPTFNDLYWYPGGDLSIKPEKSRSAEVSVKRRAFDKEHRHFTYSITGFYQNVSDWIQWQPNLTGYWSADNVEEVTRKGIESSAGYTFYFKKLRAQLKAHYTLVDTRDGADDMLIYVPVHSGKLNAHLTFKNWDGSYFHEFTGQRSVTPDGSLNMPAFQLGHVSMGRTVQIGNKRLVATAAVRNLFDAKYQVMANRPTPGRWYSLTLKWVI